MKNWIRTIQIVMIVMIGQVLSQGPSCRNHKNADVDWWIIFKFPQDSQPRDPFGNRIPKLTGFEYLYCDSNACTETTFYQDLMDINSPLFYTISQASFTPSASQMSIAWNDQQVHGASSKSKRGHSKGLLSADSTQGFIINHSLPNFPIVDTFDNIQRLMPPNADSNGQHFFCVTMLTGELNKVARQLWEAQVHIFKSNNVAALASYTNLYSLRLTNSGKGSSSVPHVIALSKGGLNLGIFAKSEQQQVDFYENIVAPALGVGLIMETWRNGNGEQNAMCGTYNILSIENRTLQTQRSSYELLHTKDHSKYGISFDDFNQYICFSDLNRMESQKDRGGTALCFIHVDLWNEINYSITRRQFC